MKKRTEILKSVDIKGKKYTQVHERIIFLANNFDYSITTNYEFIEDLKMFIVKAELIIHSVDNPYAETLGPLKRVYHGTAQEIIGDGYINKTSALENCETSAIGRACAMAGIGLVDSIASVDEINKAKNISSLQNTGKKQKATKKPIDDSGMKYLIEKGTKEDINLALTKRALTDEQKIVLTETLKNK